MGEKPSGARRALFELNSPKRQIATRVGKFISYLLLPAPFLQKNAFPDGTFVAASLLATKNI